MSNQDQVLIVKNLTTVFKSDREEFVAVNNISFELNRGETLTIVGESGSGKSVTSLSIMRLINYPGEIKSGTIHYSTVTGESIDLLSIEEREMESIRGNEIAMIFQEPMSSLNPVMTCGKQVMESLILHKQLTRKEAEEQTLKLFKEVQLPRPEAMLKSYPHQLSGGQRQRVMIAMAICCEPQILIADEPTTALDVTVQAAILDLLKKIQQERNMSMIFITHDLGIVSNIADKVAVMYRGSIVESGNRQEIFGEPKHPYTEGLLACRPPLNIKLFKLPTMADFMRKEDGGEVKATGASLKDIYISYRLNEAQEGEERQQLYQNHPILSVKNLVTEFEVNSSLLSFNKKHFKAVDDISFDLYPGEVLGVVGESGSGKTTLGRSVLRLIEPSSGMINFNGTDLLSLNRSGVRKMRRNMQIVFQDPYSSLNPRMTIGKAIAEPITVHRLRKGTPETRKRVNELLDLVSLPTSVFNRYPHEFSGGQRQRICIARALAVEPQLLICDESVSALDVSVQASVLNLFNDLKRELGLSYIFISHDLSVVKFMSDRIIVMKDGKVQEEGSAEQIYNNPQTEYTKSLIAAVPKVDIAA